MGADPRPSAAGAARPKPAASYKVVGQSIQRLDLPAKVTGGAYVHDVLPKDVLHARVLRQPAGGELRDTVAGQHVHGSLQHALPHLRSPLLRSRHRGSLPERRHAA